MKFAEKMLYDPAGDSTYQHPVIDEQKQGSRKIPDAKNITYQYIHGHFEGTHVKFLFCFPERERYEGRFFQHLSPFPGPDEELSALNKTGEDDFVSFALTHGACYVESNMGSERIFGKVDDPKIFYQSNAAVAEYCRTVAQQLYGKHRVYGYAFGGSGGGYKTMSCIENTASFDGAVPFVIGSPMSLPNCLTVPAYGKRLLRNSWQKVVDALDAGGSGDPYCVLNQEESDALREITKMGFPPQMCISFGNDDDGSLPVLAPTVHEFDETYFTDFWTKPGYLGAEENGSARKDRICLRTKVVRVGVMERSGKEKTIDDRNGTDTAWQKMLSDGSNAWIEVAEVPTGEDLYLKGAEIIFESGKAKGKKLSLGSISGRRLIPGMSFGADDISKVAFLIQAGDEIRIDNSDYIAIQAYHRHQVPADLSFHAWDQYRDKNGKPKLPQRKEVISYGFTAGGCGSVQDGKIQGHVIVVNSLMDTDFPWQADWYRRKVEAVYGEKAKEIFRIWYNENAPHGDMDETSDKFRMVSYLGMLRQALLDVAHWTEDGVLPAENTGYQLADNQIVLTKKAAQRGGSQPIAMLLANGSSCACVRAGEEVSFTVKTELSPTAGKLESVELSFAGEEYEKVSLETRSEWQQDGCCFAEVTVKHRFKKPGTYFSVVRVVSNRQKGDVFTRLRNLARVRIVVK